MPLFILKAGAAPACAMPVKGGKVTAPPAMPFKAPPKPRGIPGRKAGGFAASGVTNTRVGDLGEQIATKFQMQSLLQGKRQNPLDVVFDGTKMAFEVKTVTVNATEYKIKMKSAEIAGKRAYAKAHGYKPGMMMIVLDSDKGQAWAYWREGIANGRLTKDWNFMGKVKA